MDNTAAYVSPPPLPPQAHLSAAFQAAVTSSASSSSGTTSFQEALMSRMGRPFGLTGDIKDLPGSPFLGLAAAARGVGQDAFPAGLPGALALSHHMGQPGFGLHHFIDPRLPFSAAAAGAFRPIFGNAAAAAAAIAASVSSTSTTSSASQLSDSIIAATSKANSQVSSSAFQPPAKGGQTSPPGATLFSPGQNLYPRSSAGSPGTPSSSPPSSVAGAPPHLHHRSNNCGGNGGGLHPGVKLPDENSNMATTALPANSALVDRHESISPASMDSSIHDSADERGAKKIRLSSSSSANNEVGCCCPICGMPLRTSELEMHYTHELEYLTKLSASLIVSANQGRVRSPAGGSNNLGHHPHHPGLLSPNMKNQLSGSLEVAPRSRWDTFQRIQRNRQSRIRVKLSRRAGKRSDEILEEDIVEPVSNSHDLHHQFHQQRTKMEQPQSSSTPAPTSSTNPDDEDIDIVGDDGNNNKNNISGNLSSSESSRDLQLHVYGPPQFTEADVLACMNELEELGEEHEDSKKSEQEEAELAAAPSTTDSPTTEERTIKREVASPALSGSAGEDEEHHTEHNDRDGHSKPKDSKIKIEDKSRCSKCLKSIKDPVVNVRCWHVQCEKCWLSSLGTKKCCSLCGTPTVPADLRRVFL